MAVKALVLMVPLAGLSVLAVLIFLCYSLFWKTKKKGTPPMATQFYRIPTYIGNEYHRSTILPIIGLPLDSGLPLSRPQKERELFPFHVQPLPPIYDTSGLDPIPEDPGQSPTGRTPRPWKQPRHLVTRESEKDLAIATRFSEGKVAELTLSMSYNHRDNALEMTINQLNKIHHSINKKTAYVRLKNPLERRISIPMLTYSKQSNSLLGKHQFRFNFTPEVLKNMTFRFYLWSTDEYSRQKEYGEFALDFKEILTTKDLSKGFIEKYDFLVYDTQPQENDPSIRLKLKYNTRTAQIVATVSEIKDLQFGNWALFAAGIYVKLIFKHRTDGQEPRSKEFRTKMIKGSNPEFNTTFNHRVLVTELQDLTLAVEIKARTIQAEKLSVLEFSSNATGRLGEHWMQMIQGISQGKGVEMTHRISQEKRKVNPIARRLSTTVLY